MGLVRHAVGCGLKFDWLVFDEGYGKDRSFLFAVDALGQTWIGEVPKSFRCWPVLPQHHSSQSVFASTWRSEGGFIAQFELGRGAKLENAEAVFEEWERRTRG